MITAQICNQEPRVSLLLGTLGGASESLPLPQHRVKPTQGPRLCPAEAMPPQKRHCWACSLFPQIGVEEGKGNSFL